MVFDASVAVKWFLEEAGSPTARSQLVQFAGEIVVPDIFTIEVIGALVRRANMGNAERQPMEVHIGRLMRLFELESLKAERLEMTQITRAAGLAIDLGHPLKDCLYLVLAMDLKCPLVTADARFAAKARNAWPDTKNLAEFP